MDRLDFIEGSALTAALLEASAPKPGNVSPFARSGKTGFEHFIVSSAAIAPIMRKLANGDYSLGQGIFHAVNGSMSIQRGGNVHLGVILLFAPIAYAAGSSESLDLASLRREMKGVIENAGYEETVYVYNAIKHAEPAGVPKIVFDKSTLKRIIESKLSLRDWMSEGKEHNLIAGEYCSDYGLSFEIALPALLNTYRNGKDIFHSIIQAFLTVLSGNRDSLILGKFGEETAKEVSKRAGEALKSGEASEIENFDGYLRKNGINPGTTADIIASALYLGILSGEIGF